MDDLPFRAEYAKSGRAACKSCKDLISNGTLRLAFMAQSAFFDGKQPFWNHYDCFFKKYRPKSTAEFANFATLKYEDQKRVEESIKSCGATSSTSEEGKSKKSKKRKAIVDGNGSTNFNDFNIEYSKSNRSKCNLCEKTIDKNLVRIGKLDYEGEKARRFGPLNRWFHVDCFIASRTELEFYASVESIPKFDELEESDQKDLKKKIKKIEEPASKPVEPTNKPVNGGDASPAKKSKIDGKLEKALKTQSDLFYKFKDGLKTLSKNEVLELMEHNEIEPGDGTDGKLDRLADAMTFGVPIKCPECQGQLVFSGSKCCYCCVGMATEWARCQYKTEKPERESFKVPADLAQDNGFLKKYKYKKRDRVYDPNVKGAIDERRQSQEAQEVKMKVKNETEKKSDKPFEGYNFVIVSGGDTYKSQELKQKIQNLGGEVKSKLGSTTLCLITKNSELSKKKKNSKLEEAEDLEIAVVSDAFLDQIGKGTEPGKALESSVLSSWGKEIEKRFKDLNVKEKMKTFKSGSFGTKVSSGPSKQKISLKSGCAVDPESGLEDVAHVLVENKDKFTVTLNLVDLSLNKNSYYKIQLLEHDTKKKFWVFTSWGRVGTSIGGTKLDEFKNKENAIQRFEEIYEEKTENSWDEKENFKKQPNCYYPVDVDYGNDEVFQKLEPGKASKLPKSVQELICMIFDVQKMKDAMVEFELDLEKMPLGKLSKKQITNAYSVLKELSELIEAKKHDGVKILDATNRFYTLIPHNFGFGKLVLIDNLDLIKSKLDMLDALLDIEMAYNILKMTDEKDDTHPIDQYYEKLNAEIEPLDKSMKEFEVIEKYVQNTHAETHRQYVLEVMDVLKVTRKNERERFEKFKSVDNRMLLWHGSRATNFAGILSQGLRIAPPEAPVTGYMFGKGIYFADMVSKSANYCCAHLNDNIGLLLLCEVAIGKPWELNNAKEVSKSSLPKESHSVKGCGKTEPDPNEFFTTEEGVKIPFGKPVKSTNKSSLLYNEYIVYDVEQVNIKYLLKLKFNYNY